MTLPTYIIAIDVLNSCTKTTCYNIQQNEFCSNFKVHETNNLNWLDAPRHLGSELKNLFKKKFDNFIDQLKKENTFLQKENHLIALNCFGTFTQEDEKELKDLLTDKQKHNIEIINNSTLDTQKPICHQITRNIVDKYKPIYRYVIYIDGYKELKGIINENNQYKLPCEQDIQVEINVLHSKYHAPTIQINVLYDLLGKEEIVNIYEEKFPKNIEEHPIKNFLWGKKHGYIWQVSFKLNIKKDWSVQITSFIITENWDWDWHRLDAEQTERDLYEWAHEL